MKRWALGIGALAVVVCGLLYGRVGYLKLAGQVEDDWVLIILGPGDDPRTCAARAAPFFATAEPAMTALAEIMVDDLTITRLTAGSPSLDQPASVGRGEYGHDRAEAPDHDPLWEQLSGYYFSPMFMERREDGALFLWGGDNDCRFGTWGWIRYINSFLPNPDAVRSRFSGDEAEIMARYDQQSMPASGFVYYPAGVPATLPCSDPFEHPGPDRESALECDLPMSDRWTFRVEFFQPDIEDVRAQLRDFDIEREDDWTAK